MLQLRYCFLLLCLFLRLRWWHLANNCSWMRTFNNNSINHGSLMALWYTDLRTCASSSMGYGHDIWPGLDKSISAPPLTSKFELFVHYMHYWFCCISHSLYTFMDGLANIDASTSIYSNQIWLLFQALVNSISPFMCRGHNNWYSLTYGQENFIYLPFPVEFNIYFMMSDFYNISISVYVFVKVIIDTGWRNSLSWQSTSNVGPYCIVL